MPTLYPSIPLPLQPSASVYSTLHQFSTSTALPVTEAIMPYTFWVGVYPGMSEAVVGDVVVTSREVCC